MSKTAVQPARTHATHMTHQPHRPAAGRSQLEPSSRVLTLGRLPGAVHGSARMPKGEFATFLVVVPLLSIPVLLATMTATWAAATTVALTAVVGWLCAARRVVIGNGWVADRRLWRYRVTHGGQLRAVELRETAHGGVLRLSPHTGRAHRLRRTEFDRPEARAALRTVLAAGSPTTNPGARTALGDTARPAMLPPAR